MRETSYETQPGVAPPWVDDEHVARLGRYLLGPELGRGGMGRVVEAWDPLLKRRVAIKLMHGASQDHLPRFFREAQHQARLEHPNICRILEMGADAEQPYIVMPLIQGISLGELRPQLDLQTLVAIMADVAGAIHVAHQAGLVHRDLKPQNILVESPAAGVYKPVVVDFGLARDFSMEDQTLSWSMVGTPAFMSPEQARCEPPTPAGDVYSLGATLYALLSGAPPFEATTLVGLVGEQTRRDAMPLRRANPDLPRDLETITLKCVEADPARRYASALELEADLRNFLEGRPIRARRITELERAWRFLKRNRTLSASMGISLLLVMALVGWNIYSSRLARRQVELAQRFGMEVQEVENVLRVERMLPPHSMVAAELAVRTRLASIQKTMETLGTAAQGPGHYALGRGHLALRDLDKAAEHLERAWRLGFRPAELVDALGVAHTEIYARKLEQAQDLPSGDAKERAERAAELEHRTRALELLQQRAANLQGSPMEMARIAYLRRQFLTCAHACQKALEAEPWRYEARILEARAWLDNARTLSMNQPLSEVRPYLERVMDVLDQAEAVGRSDVEIHAIRLSTLVMWANLENEGGEPNLDIFRRADKVFETAILIQPENRELWTARFAQRCREGILRLNRGEDTEAFFQALLGMVQEAQRHHPSLFGNRNAQVVPLWYIGESRWRWGRDPRPVLTEGLGIAAVQGISEAEMHNLAAKHAWQHGDDPRPHLALASAILARVSAQEPDYHYTHTIQGESHLIQATWEYWTGRDPLPTLDLAIQTLQRAAAFKPTGAYTYFHLPLAHAMKAEVLLQRGLSPDAEVAAALEAGRQGVHLRPTHFRCRLGEAEAYRAEALALLRTGKDPRPAFNEAEQALQRSRRFNGSDWRVALAEARLALDMAAWTVSAGKVGGDFFARAQTSARRGLALKPDAPELHWVLAEALSGAGRLAQDGAAAASRRKALTLCPSLVSPRSPAEKR